MSSLGEIRTAIASSAADVTASRHAGHTYWRSLDELANTPTCHKFVEGELANMTDGWSAEPSRRKFMQLMGASLALAGLTSCRWPREEIAPFASQPTGRTPGKPVRYATAMELGGVAQGLLVTSYDGRPIKIEGNPLHPINRGATDAYAQASILELYDPDRSRTPIRRDAAATEQGAAQTWDDFATVGKAHFEALRQRGGEGLYVLNEATSSPSREDMRGRLLGAMPQAQWLEYEPLSWDNERAGAAMVFGCPYRTHLVLDEADVIVCLDADLLMTHPAAIKHARDFVAGRQVDRTARRRDNGGPMNRLYVVESVYSLTGSMADHRRAMPASNVAMFGWYLAAELARRGVPVFADNPARREQLLTAALSEPDAAFARLVAAELLAASGRSVIAVGPRQPAVLHALAHCLNAVLGNVGKTINYTGVCDPWRPLHVAGIKSLAADVAAGKVDTLLILGGNPVFNAPADLEFGRRLTAVRTSIHLSSYNDETSRACTWHLPRAHYLESWGDARAYDGTISIVQPLIEPLHGGKSAIEVLAMLLGDQITSGHDIVRRTFGELFDYGVDRQAMWQQALHDGIVADTALPIETPAPLVRDWVEDLVIRALAGTQPANHSELVLVADSHVYDGRFANNGWLQEMPDPLTKLTWDNAAIIGPTTADRLGVGSGDVVKLTVDGRSLEIAAFVLPGQAENSVAVPLGYGRTAAGRVGNCVGVNLCALRTTAQPDWNDVRIEKTGRRYPLATTQDHHAMDSKVGRRATAERIPWLVREATVEHYKDHPDFAKHVVHHPPLVSLFKETTPVAGEHRWAMAIDLNACIGCGVCVVACQAENNVPVVGKDEVARGREMQWLRVDRYFTGDPRDPRVVHQPVACHHCENAPCEQVCPVAATVHSHEGLNDMVYNRCIGTRYCSNNCPYKVRRFNWFNNHTNVSEIEKLAFNPEVTVRSRGVMEKCTYCVQRIAAVKIVAKNEGRPIADGEVVPACAQACPTRAIVFGDLGDANSAVARLHADQRAYAMLAELNVKPRTMYLARLRNTCGRKDEG